MTGPAIMESVVRSFGERGAEAIFDDVDFEAARKTCPRNLWKMARRELDQINRVKDLIELVALPGKGLERLRADRNGQHSIRINDQYRVCFRWEAGDVDEVEIADYH